MQPTSATKRPARVALATIVAILIGLPLVAPAQQSPAEAVPDLLPASAPPVVLTEVEARSALAQTLPDTAPLQDRIDLLLRQRAAARVLGDQGSLLKVLDQLTAIGKGRPDWANWMLDLMNGQFTYGSQTKSIEIGEALVAESGIAPGLRSNASANLAWKYCQINDRRNCERAWVVAQRAYEALPADFSAVNRDYATVQNLQAKGEAMRVRGDADGRVEALREAVAIARRNLERVGSTTGADPKNVAYRGAINLYDYTSGQLIYALDAQGRSAEGVAVAQDGLARARLGNLGPDALGAWNQRLAAALVGERRYEEALSAARVSATELTRAGGQVDGLQMALARNAEILSLISLERWQEADQAYATFLDAIRGDRAAYDRSYNGLLYALLAAKNGRVDVALKTIEGSYRYRQRIYGANHYQTTEARAVRGCIYLIGNSPGNAMSDYEDFFTVLLDTPSGWTDLAPVGPRGAYLNIVLTEYLKYAVRLYANGGQDAIDARMFNRLVQVADRLGSGAAQRAILESSAKVRTGDPALVAMLGQEQDLRGKVRDAYALAYADVQSSDAKDTPDDKKKQLREQLKQHREQAESVQKQLDDVRKQLATKFPAFLQLVNPVNPNSGTIRKALMPGEAFVGIYPSREGTFAWAVAASGKTALAISKWTDADVTNRVAAMRATLDVGDRLPRLPAMDFAAPQAIYDELIKPLRPALAGATVLDISAGGALGSLPMAALVTGPATDVKTAPWLVKEFAIAQTPGAAAFVTLRGVESRGLAAKPLIGFGDPQLRLGAAATSAAGGPPRARNLVVVANGQQASTYSVEKGFRYASIPPLPETRDELIALAKALGADPQSDLVLGAAATRKAVMTTPLADRRVVAFATHGLLPGEIPTLSKPALAMAATDDNESPLLNLDDVLTLKLNAQWVVLSACNTAGGERDGVAMSGLVRGFFFAGTRSVLATQWAVESEASRQLVGQVFANAAKDPTIARAVDLQRAQLAMIDGSLGGGGYAHPFYWAPYTLFGDPIR
ncbi:MAG: CHAT domain-containing protein [Burkholderiaceae bacterium]